MKKSERSYSILNKFTLYYLLHIFIAVTISGFVFLFFTYHSKEIDFKSRVKSHSSTFADVVAYPLWSYDYDAVNRYTRLFLRNELVCSVSIYDSSGKVIISEANPCFNRIRNTGLAYLVSVPVIYNGNKIGTIEIVYSKMEIKNFIDDFMLLMSIFVIVLAFVLLLGVNFLIKNYILKPLYIIGKVIENIRNGNYVLNPDHPDIAFREFEQILVEVQKMVNAIKEREEDLKDVNYELKVLLESMPDGFFLMDLNGNILQVNDSAVKMFNYSEEKLLRMNAMDLSDESFTKNQMKNFFEETLQNGSVTFRWLARSNEGVSFWILVRLKVVTIKGERYLIALILDIDDQVKLETMLKESEEKFRVFTENTMAAVFLYKEFFEYVNPAMCRILGYSEEELLKTHFWEVFHPEERDLVKTRGLKRIEGFDDIPQSYEFRIIRKDGKTRWVEFVATPIEFRGEKKAIGTAIDITARKVYQEGLKEEKEKLAATLRSIAEGVIVLDEKGSVKMVNKASERLLGSSEGEMIGKSCSEILNFYIESDGMENEIKRVSITFKEAINGYQNDNLFLFKGREEKIYVAVSASPIKIGDRVLGAVVVISDITEHEVFKREIVRQKKLESLATLAAGIAHDFNNMLQVLQGNIELARLKASEDVKPVLEKALNSLSNATKLARRLLTFAKGGAPIKQRLVDFRGYLKRLIDFHFAGSNIKVFIDVEENLLPLEVDVTQLEQVFQNIFVNAKDALKGIDRPIVRVKVENFSFEKRGKHNIPLKEKFSNYIHISIEDNGPGIPQEIIDRIFEPYFTTKKYGSGLGLAVAYSIVIKHEGYIAVENKPEGGVIFHIYLPVKEGFEFKEEVTEEKKSEYVVAGQSEGKKEIDFYSLKILFMDDEPDVREVAEDFAFALNCNLIAVENGEEAIKVYKEAFDKGERFDLVFVDLTVAGGMGGEETLERLKEIDPDVKVVVSSGYAHSSAMAEFRKRGFVNVLPKPYLLEDFKRVIKESLS